MSAIGIAYDGFNLLFDTFTGAEVARAYDASVGFSRGLSGQQILTGRPGRQKFIWAINAVLSEDDAKKLDDIFQAWDASRATGVAAALGITDQTLFDPVTTSAVFTTPPSYIRMNAYTYSVAFGLTEV